MLDSLEVLNGSMTPEFKSDEFEYNVVVDEDVLALVMDYEAPENVSITVYGNNHLTEGENHVLIEVYDTEVKTYTLTVMKQASSEVSGFESVYEKVEVDSNQEWREYVTPGIGIVCFLTIAFLFCVIFKRK